MVKNISKKPTKAVLEDQLSVSSIEDLAKQYATSTRTIYNWMKSFDIPRTGNDGRLPRSFMSLINSPDLLEAEYRAIGVERMASLHQPKTVNELGKKVGNVVP